MEHTRNMRTVTYLHTPIVTWRLAVVQESSCVPLWDGILDLASCVFGIHLICLGEWSKLMEWVMDDNLRRPGGRGYNVLTAVCTHVLCTVGQYPMPVPPTLVSSRMYIIPSSRMITFCTRDPMLSKEHAGIDGRFFARQNVVSRATTYGLLCRRKQIV